MSRAFRRRVAAGCAELEDLFVCEEKRRRGVGRALLAAAEDVARIYVLPLR